ncbi:MAG TPA: GNAT family N-acetyltransferase [Firmicutes bacterium]|jgi:GNAT superfamily N-acetyltransferase|nr:GNAT family N-acetyltransferase [Bacillota bacterium]
MVDYIVRQATARDIPALCALLKILFSIEADFAVDEQKQRNGLELMINTSEERCIMVAELQGTIIGMCTAQLVISTAEGGNAALIEDMVIHEDYRRQGIGRRLLQEIEAWALKHGSKRLQLLADRNNSPALAYYQRLGWRPTQLMAFQKKPES